MRTTRRRSTRPVSSSPSAFPLRVRTLSQSIPALLLQAFRASAAALAAMLAASCQPAPTAVQIEFSATYAGAPLGCVIGQSGRALTDLRFYVHNVEMTTSAGRALPLQLLADDRWQNRAVALVDLEDGQGYCVNGTSAMHSVVRGEVALKTGESIEGLRFSIGVPEKLNHADPMAAGVPLNYTVMHWHWRSGYKFMRAGLVDAGGSAWLHLGSARCAGTIGSIDGCAASNRPLVTVQPFDPAESLITVDLAGLFEQGANRHEGARSCESGVDDPECQSIFAALGLDTQGGGVARSAPAFLPRKR